MNNPDSNNNPSGPQSAPRGGSVQFHEVKPQALLRLLAQTLAGLQRQGYVITAEQDTAGLTLHIPGVTRNEAGALVLATPEPA